MTRTANIAVVGATGAVGEVLLTVLAERKFPINKLYAVASSRSAGKIVDFNRESIEVQDIEDFDFANVEIALFSAGSAVSEKYAPIAASYGCVVVDNTSCFRYDPEIPLVVPEVNAEAIEQFTTRYIIANPNCSTIQMLVALKPLHDQARIRQIHVSTYQAVSGSGNQAVKELIHQCGELLNGRPVKPSVYPEQIAFNVLPHIDSFQENGYTREEMKMVWETKKILNDDTIQVNPTAVRVPVLYGHSEAIHITCEQPITPQEAHQILSQAPGVCVRDDFDQHRYPTPIADAVGQDEVYVGRIRQDLDDPYGLNLWVVADNIRKGAATNAVQIAEILIEKYL